MSESRYLQALLAHLREAPADPGSVVHVEVRHDDDCGIWAGRPCDCSPEIETGGRVERKYDRRGAGGEGTAR